MAIEEVCAGIAETGSVVCSSSMGKPLSARFAAATSRSHSVQPQPFLDVRGLLDFLLSVTDTSDFCQRTQSVPPISKRP